MNCMVGMSQLLKILYTRSDKRLKLSHLADFLCDLKGLIDESARSIVVHKLVAMLTGALSGSDNYRDWVYTGSKQFLRACELTPLSSGIPATLQLEPTELATLCDKWLKVNLFRPVNGGEEDWRPITPDMNNLRVSMITELKNLAESLDNTIE